MIGHGRLLLTNQQQLLSVVFPICMAINQKNILVLEDNYN